jgi:hypothetical protein
MPRADGHELRLGVDSTDRVVVRVNHNLAAQIDSLRLGAGAENTK